MTTVPVTPPNPSNMYVRRRPAVNPWLVRLPVLVITGGILTVLLLSAFVALVQVRYQNEIYPGVSAYNLHLGGMTPAEATAALDNEFTYAADTVFTFRAGEQFWQLSAADLGVTFDAQATAAAAFHVGHSGNLIIDLVDQGLTWLNGEPISPVIHYDQNIAAAQLTVIAEQVNRPPQNASLVVAGTTVTTTAGQPGWTVDIPATLAQVDESILSLGAGGEIPLVITETQPLIRDAEAAAQQIRAALSSPLTLMASAADGQSLGPWTAAPEQIAHLLAVELVTGADGTQQYAVSLDMSAYRPQLEQMAAGLTLLPADGRYVFNDETGELEIVEAAVHGRELNVEQTLARMEEAIFSDNRVVAMAFDETLPRYHNDLTAAELGITELISEATTYYTGSTEPRRQNIAAAAARYNGVIVAPGEIFSFNEFVGEITPEEGYVEGFVISGGRTIKGVGGGVCQVSTTAFQAAFFAGFPILERFAHGYRVGYYDEGAGVGLDAAIYTPTLDMRFQNDTDYHLLIETSLYPAENAVQFRFYSTNPGRQVVKEGPEIRNVTPAAATRFEVNPELQPGQERWVDWAAEGAEVVVTRVILDEAGNEIDREPFYSRYQPWGAIVQVPPGDPRAAT